MIEIVDDDVAINEYDNSDLSALNDDDIVPPRPWRIHRSEYEMLNGALNQYLQSKLTAEELKSHDLSDICDPSNLAQSDPEDVALIDFREIAASVRMTYGEFKEWIKHSNKTMAEAFATRGSIF